MFLLRRLNKSHLKAIFDAAPVGMLLIDENTVVTKACVAGDDDIAEMIDTKILPHRDLAGEFNTGDNLDQLEAELV